MIYSLSMTTIFSLHGILFLVIAIIARLIVGMFWYSKFMFQKPWMKEQGKSSDHKPAQGSRKAMAIMSGMLILSTIILAFFIVGPMGSNVIIGVIVTIMIWIGFVLPTHVHYRIFSLQNPQPSWKYIMINAGQEFFGILVAALVLSFI